MGSTTHSQNIKGKAPGPDNVTMDLIEAAGEEIYDKLANVHQLPKKARFQTAGTRPSSFYYSRKAIRKTLQTTVQSDC